MNRHVLTLLCGMVACLVLQTGLLVAAEKDQVEFVQKGKTETRKGDIVDDELRGVKMTGDKNGMPRAIIREVYYGDTREVFQRAKTKFLEGDYRDAIRLLKTAVNAAKSLPAPKQKLFKQYTDYYLGVCYLKTRKFGDAETALAQALAPQNPTFFFEASLARGDVREAKRQFKEARDYFNLLAKREFPNKAKMAPKAAPRFIFVAELSALRNEIKRQTSSAGNKIGGLLSNLDTLAGDPKNAAFLKADAALNAEVLSLRARIFKYNKEYTKLIGILHTPIQSAVASNNRDALASLYQDRADAYFGLFEGASGDEKKKLAKMARFEYFRVTLGYKVAAADMAKDYYRLGLLFAELKDSDWAPRAAKFLKKATKVTGGEKYGQKADELFKTLEAEMTKAMEKKDK